MGPTCQFVNRAGSDDEFSIPFAPGVWYDPVSEPVRVALHPGYVTSLNQARRDNLPVFFRSPAD